MNNNLIDKYLYATGRYLPRKNRNDILKELRSLIDDMITERSPDARPTEQQVLDILCELGTPLELAGKYSPDATRSLIGPAYFPSYKQVLQIVLICTGFGMLLAHIILLFVEPPHDASRFFMGFLSWLGSTLSACVTAFGFVTILFAFFQHKKISMPDNDDKLKAIINLPAVPDKKDTLSKSEGIFGIAFSIIFAVLFLAFPEIMGVYHSGEAFVPVFNVSLLQSLWPIIISFSLCGIISASLAMTEERYTIRYAIVNTVCNILSIGLAYIMFVANNVINPTFVSSIVALLSPQDTVPAILFENFGLFIFAIFCLAILIDTITTVYNTWRTTRSTSIDY